MAFAREAVVGSRYENSGVTRIKRATAFVEQLSSSATMIGTPPVAKANLDMLTPQLRKALYAPYLKSATGRLACP